MRIVSMPGDDPAVPTGEHSDPDAATGTGIARRIKKPRKAVPVAEVSRPDEQRPESAPVNLENDELTQEEALAGVAAGTITKSVLTVDGWLAVEKEPPAQAKR